MRFTGNKFAAIAIDILLFLTMLFCGSLYLSGVWLFLAIFFVFLPLSHFLSLAITKVNVADVLFK